MKLSGSYYLIGFFHETDINYYEDISHVIVEYEKTKERFKFKSMIKTDFEIDVIQMKLRSKTIDDYVEGSWSSLSEDLPEKMNRLKSFFNKNLNPDKLLSDKKIELVEKHLFTGTGQRRLKIEAEKKGEIIIRY